MACISIASVIVNPLNPSSLINKSLIAFGDNEVANFGVLSIAGTDKWATITEPMPAFISALKGANSIESRASLDLFITGISTCESTLTSP